MTRIIEPTGSIRIRENAAVLRYSLWIIGATIAACILLVQFEIVRLGPFEQRTLWPLLALSAACFLIAWCMPQLNVDIDVGIRMLRWQRRQAGQLRRVLVSFDRVQNVIAQPSASRDNGIGVHIRYVVIAVLNDGQHLPLSIYDDPDQARSERFAQEVRRVLMGSPRQGSTDAAANTPDEVESLLRSGLRVAAVEVLRRREHLTLEQAQAQLRDIERKIRARLDAPS